MCKLKVSIIQCTWVLLVMLSALSHKVRNLQISCIIINSVVLLKQSLAQASESDTDLWLDAFCFTLTFVVDWRWFSSIYLSHESRLPVTMFVHSSILCLMDLPPVLEGRGLIPLRSIQFWHQMISDGDCLAGWRLGLGVFGCSSVLLSLVQV